MKSSLVFFHKNAPYVPIIGVEIHVLACLIIMILLNYMNLPNLLMNPKRPSLRNIEKIESRKYVSTL